MNIRTSDYDGRSVTNVDLWERTMRDYCFVYLLSLSVMVPEQVIFNSAQSASKRKKERNRVINKLRTLSHSNTEGKEI